MKDFYVIMFAVQILSLFAANILINKNAKNPVIPYLLIFIGILSVLLLSYFISKVDLLLLIKNLF